MFSRNSSGNIVYKDYQAGRGWATSFRTFDGTVIGGPAASSWSASRIDLFARSATGGRLLHRWSTDAGRNWSAWEDLTTRLQGPGIISDPAAVSWGLNRIDIFARGESNGLVHYYYDVSVPGIGGSHWNAVTEPGDITSSPAVCSWQEGRLDVMARWSDGQNGHTWYDRSVRGWVGLWEGWGEAPTSKPAAVSMRPGRLDNFSATGTTLKQRYYQR